MKITSVVGLAAAAALALTPVGLALSSAPAGAASSSHTASTHTASTHVASSNTASTHTTELVVRPVHANGRAVAGYRVHAEKIDGFTCDGASPVAVSKNVYECGPSAAYTVACWKSAKHTVLCLRDPHVKNLARIRYTGALTGVAAPAKPVPQALTLTDAQRCDIRDGGAWDSINGRPTWSGTYSCTKGDLYGPPAFQGIDASVNPWRVHMLTYYRNGKQHLVDHRVAHSYFVGTAS